MARPEELSPERAQRDDGPARWRGPPRDWTPVVLIVCSLCVSLAAMIWVLERWRTGDDDLVPGDEHAERRAPAEVDLWVGEPPPQGMKLVLTSVWGDRAPDADHEERLRVRLGLPSEAPLAWYRLLLFNLSSETRRVVLTEDALVLEGQDGRAHLRNLAALLRDGGPKPPLSLEVVLKGLGALREVVELAPGMSVPLLVCFDRRVDLATARSVAGGDGTSFRRRRISRGDLQRLLADPDEASVREL